MRVFTTINRYFFLMVLISLFQPLPSLATTWYVATNGSDSNPGTQAMPFRTIQKAGYTAIAGDEVRVSSGFYSEKINLYNSGTSGSPIVFQSLSPVTNGVLTRGFKAIGSYLTIKGFTATAPCTGGDSDRSGFYVEGDHVQLVDNFAIDNNLYGIMTANQSEAALINNNIVTGSVMAGISIQGTNHQVLNNDVSGTVEWHDHDSVCKGDADGIRFFGQGHIISQNFIHGLHFNDTNVLTAHIDCFQTWADYSYYWPAEDVIIEKNHCEALTYNSTDDHGCGLMIANSQRVIVRNNLFQSFRGVTEGSTGDNNNLSIVNNVFVSDLSFPIANHFPMGISVSSPNLTVVNNIFYNFKSHISNQISTPSLYAANIAFRRDGVMPDLSECGSGCLVVDPLFINPDLSADEFASRDFHLQANSPAIDSGRSGEEWGVVDDWDNDVRPQGNGYDIGIDETTIGKTVDFITVWAQWGQTGLLSGDIYPAEKDGKVNVFDAIFSWN